MAWSLPGHSRWKELGGAGIVSVDSGGEKSQLKSVSGTKAEEPGSHKGNQPANVSTTLYM